MPPFRWYAKPSVKANLSSVLCRLMSSLSHIFQGLERNFNESSIISSSLPAFGSLLRGFHAFEPCLFQADRACFHKQRSQNRSSSVHDTTKQSFNLFLDIDNLALRRTLRVLRLGQTGIPSLPEHGLRQSKELWAWLKCLDDLTERIFELVAWDRFSVALTTLRMACIIWVTLIFAFGPGRPQRRVAIAAGGKSSQSKVHTSIFRSGAYPVIFRRSCSDRVQEHLKITGYAPERKNTGVDFALRGFATCGDCNASLRSSWSKGKYKSYPIYACHTKGCESYGKCIHATSSKNAFGEVVKTLEPSPSLLL